MNSSTLLLILVAVGISLAVLFLVPAPTPTVEPPSSTTQGTANESSTQSDAGAGRPSVVVDAGADVTVGERETVRLTGVGYDSAGGPVTVLWTAEAGLGFFSDPRALTTSYMAPSACDCEDCVTLTLTVSGGGGVSASDRITLHVRDLLACPTPRTTCGSPPAVTQCCTPQAAVNPCPKPDVPCGSPCMSQVLTAPTCSQVPVACRCSQGCGPAWDSAWPEPATPLTVRDHPRPMIIRQFERHVTEGTSVRLGARIANPACSSVCYVWSATKGWFDGADTLEPTYHAPWTDRPEGETVIVTLTTYDAAPGASYDQIRFVIDNVGG